MAQGRRSREKKTWWTLSIFSLFLNFFLQSILSPFSNYLSLIFSSYNHIWPFFISFFLFFPHPFHFRPIIILHVLASILLHCPRFCVIGLGKYGISPPCHYLFPPCHEFHLRQQLALCPVLPNILKIFRPLVSSSICFRYLISSLFLFCFVLFWSSFRIYNPPSSSSFPPLQDFPHLLFPSALQESSTSGTHWPPLLPHEPLLRNPLPLQEPILGLLFLLRNPFSPTLFLLRNAFLGLLALFPLPPPWQPSSITSSWLLTSLWNSSFTSFSIQSCTSVKHAGIDICQ